MERKHEGIMRFKCHVMNCTFGSSAHKDLRRHAKTHEKELLKIELNKNKASKIDCDQEGCNAKVVNIKRHAKTHGKESLTCDQVKVKVSRDA